DQERQKLHDRYWADPEKARAAKRADHRKHAETRNAARRIRRAANPAQARSNAKRWRIDRLSTNPEGERTKEQDAYKRRRAREKGAPINDLTHAQWLEIQAVQDHRCFYCGKRRKGHLTQ